MKNLYHIIHIHKFGTSVYQFKSKLLYTELPEHEELAQILGIDFETDREESFEVDIVVDKVVDLDKLMKEVEA